MLGQRNRKIKILPLVFWENGFKKGSEKEKGRVRRPEKLFRFKFAKTEQCCGANVQKNRAE